MFNLPHLGDEEKFALFLVGIQGLVTVGAVVLAAVIALRSFKKQSALTRSRASAEKVWRALAGLAQASRRYRARLARLERGPAGITDLDLGDLQDTFSMNGTEREIDLIENSKVRKQAEWAIQLIAEFREQIIELQNNSAAMTVDELLAKMDQVATYSQEVHYSIRRYLRNERLPRLSQPTSGVK